MRSLRGLLAPGAALALILAIGGVAHAVSIDWVTVGDRGNAADDTDHGTVAYTYKISKYEVTNGQYADFLNAVDPTGANALGLYSAGMLYASGGIRWVSSNLPGSKYVLKADHGNRPVNFVSFYDALRFANWLNNGQGSADTETGAYTFAGGLYPPDILRNEGATIFLPSEDEWYKAAYYDAGSASYFEYPAGLDTAPLCTWPGATANTANCGHPDGEALADVGSYTGSASPYGTFDQGGNVWEWNEARIGGSDRGLRGGGYVDSQSTFGLAASYRVGRGSLDEFRDGGFRVAMIPEPSTGLLVVTGMLGLAAWRRRGAG